MAKINNTMDVFKLLPKTNCRKCNKPTCLAFAAAVFQGQTSLNECPFIDENTLNTYGAEINKYAGIRKSPAGSATQKVGILEDALIAHNLAVSEELLHLDASSIIGEVKEKNIIDCWFWKPDFQLWTTTILKNMGIKENRHDRQ